MMHGGIVRRHQALRKHSGNRGVQPSLMQLGLQRLLQKISDLALRRSPTNVQRMPWNLAGPSFGAQKSCSYLRPVAMREHDVVARADQSDNLYRRASRVRPLLRDRALFSRANQRIPAHRKKHGLHKKTQPSVFRRREALPTQL